MPQSKDFKVSIVSGGMCGLMCAVGLRRAGIAVEIFESTVSISSDCFLRINKRFDTTDQFSGDWSWYWIRLLLYLCAGSIVTNLSLCFRPERVACFEEFRIARLLDCASF